MIEPAKPAKQRVKEREIVKVKRPASQAHPKVPGWGNVIDQVSDGGGYLNLVSFGSNKYGYIDQRLLLHYLPWEYSSAKKAKMALIKYARAGLTSNNWFVRRGDKVSTLPFDKQ